MAESRMVVSGALLFKYAEEHQGDSHHEHARPVPAATNYSTGAHPHKHARCNHSVKNTSR